ncbi:MAG: hypothetical protein IT236_17260 [Bacteroidia bacterium]|nr:hypothetical protein [Bacteroidia bacterium]
MRSFSITLLLFLTINLFAQRYDSLGVDHLPTLNQQELDFLNTSLKNFRDTFDFANKKIAFITSKNGSSIITKQNYFLNCVKPWTDRGATPQISLVRLSPTEKLKSGGYDALVLSWVILFTNKQKKKVIEELGKK